MYSSASVAASECTTSSSEPSRKTMACRTASRSGCTPSSAGISGKTAAPSAPCGSSSLMLAARDSGNDGQLIAVLHRRVQVLEEANVLVVEVNVDEALELALVEQALGQPRKLLAQIIQNSLHS